MCICVCNNGCNKCWDSGAMQRRVQAHLVRTQSGGGGGDTINERIRERRHHATTCASRQCSVTASGALPCCLSCCALVASSLDTYFVLRSHTHQTRMRTEQNKARQQVGHNKAERGVERGRHVCAKWIMRCTPSKRERWEEGDDRDCDMLFTVTVRVYTGSLTRVGRGCIHNTQLPLGLSWQSINKQSKKTKQNRKCESEGCENQD
jgi:hypothetical protein